MVKFEISRIQEQFWILQNLYPDTAAYNLPSLFKIEGELNLNWLENALSKVVLRHDMLRTRYYEDGDKIFQEVNNTSFQEIRVDVIRIDEPFLDNNLNSKIIEEINTAFNLSCWPLFRVKLFNFNTDISVLAITFHHIIADLHSLNSFVNELSEIYNSYSAGTSPSLADPVNNYPGYSPRLNEWLFSEKGKRKVEEWKNEIPDKPEPLEIPGDFTRPDINTLEGRRKHFVIDNVTSEIILECAGKNSVNEFSVLLGAYALLLHRLSNQSKIIIGVPFANRKSTEFKDTFGCFVNILPVVVDFTKILKGEDLLIQIFQTLLNVHRRQEVPFLLLNSILGENDAAGLFQAGFTFEPPLQLNLNGTEIVPLMIERKGAQLDLFLSLWEADGKYNAYLQYSTLLFKEESVVHFWKIFCKTVQSLTENPQLFLADVITTPEEDLRFISEFNSTEVEYEDKICIHQKFERQVENTPDAPALLFNDQVLSYRELNDHANKMANALLSEGLQVEEIVGICIDRSAEMMIGILGILKAGGAYLPLSPDTPTDRLRSIIIDASPIYILTTRKNSGNLPPESPLLYIDDIIEKPLSENSSDPVVEVNSGNLAYIIYTSGSTGTPKGVMIEHHSVLNRLGWMQRAYPISKYDTLLQKTPITFDVSVWELFWWSFNGAKLVLLPQGGEKDPETIVSYISKYKVTTIHFVPSMFLAFFEMLRSMHLFHKLETLNRLFLSGEALPVKLVSEFNDIRKDYSLPDLINLYGPTEATVDVSYYNCPTGEIDTVYIGRPIDNTKLFVLNNSDKIQPLGVPGELIITGVNLARGYLNHPELTLQRFFYLNISDGKTIRAYRTGDLVKLALNGEIDYLGRLDNQVKIRGFRIELGDIESKILEYQHVSNCVVIVAENIEPKSLIAYICFKQGVKTDEESIRRHLSEKLPEYMIPSYFVFLDSLPLTSSGKLSRKNLPGPSRERTVSSIVHPTTRTEEKLLGIWKDLLRTDNVSITDNFFEIGGNSLLAIRIINKIKEEIGYTISFKELITHPTIIQSGIYIDSHKKYEGDVINLVPHNERTNLPLTINQKRIWILTKLNPEIPTYIIPVTYQINGVIDHEIFRRSIEILFQRHFILFSVIKENNGEPYSDIVPGEIHIELIDFSCFKENSGEKVIDFIDSDSVKIFDLENGPLYRLFLIKTGDNEFYFHFSIHHIIFDGWSLPVLINDLTEIYSGLVNNTTINLKNLVFQQYDFAFWEKQSIPSRDEKRSIEFWKSNLSNIPPVLNFPFDFLRKSKPSGKGGREKIYLSQDVSGKLRKISKDENASLFSTMLSTYAILLKKYSGEADICIGTPVAYRPHSELEKIIGMFVNTLVIRIQFLKDFTFRKLIHSTAETIFNALEHQDLPFEKIVEVVKPERFSNINPIFQLSFVWQDNLNVSVHVNGIEARRVSGKQGTAVFDLTLNMWENGDIIEGEIEFSTDIFKRETIIRLLDNYKTLIEHLVEDTDINADSLPIISKEEIHRINSFNQTKREYPKDKTIIQLFEEQARSFPDKDAVSYKGQSITYKQLNGKANQLARRLKSLGVGRNTPVSILADKSIEMIIGIIGILKAGGGYVPVDPDFPDKRMNFILKDTDCKIILTQDKFMSADVDGVTMVNLSSSDTYDQDSTNPESLGSSSDMAYIMYTSGTTGIPKGSIILQYSVVRLIRNTNYIDFTSDDRILLTGAIVFDATTFEIWGALLNGLTLFLVAKETILDAKELGEELRKNDITILWLTSSLFTHIAESRTDIFSHLKYLLVGGDVLSPPHINKVRRDNPDLKVINGYGPTENTTFSTTFLIDRDFENNIPIGKPISNSTVYIFDQYMNYQPIGVIGELYVGGDGLSKGYINRENLNEKSFIEHPDYQGVRLYRTGDYAKWLPDGNIEFHGRIDNQLKIRGFRIELEEIESAILEIEGIIETVVKPIKFQDGDTRLAAFLNVLETFSMDAKELSSRLKQKLPIYMVPALFRFMQGFPKTINGKTNRDALIIDIGDLSGLTNQDLGALSDNERIIYDIWCDALKMKDISVSDNFFEIGGNSLLAISVFTRILSRFNVELSLRVFFDSPRIRDIAEAVDFASHKFIENTPHNQSPDSDNNIIEGEL